MRLYPAVVVHGMADVRRALAAGGPVTLLSAPGAGLYGGCLWWRELIARGRAEFPEAMMIDVLDCADGTAQAWAALRIGVRRLVLLRGAPGRHHLARAVRAQGGLLLADRPQHG